MLKKKKIYWILFIILAFFVVIEIAGLVCSHTPSNDQRSQHNTYQENNTTGTPIISPIIRNTTKGLICITDWIGTNSATVVALATIAIALFTGTLWWATIGMFRTAQEQSKHMETSIAVADKSAKAAQESADAAKSTVEAMKDTAERQLRAYVYMETIDTVNIIPPPRGKVQPPNAWVYQPASGPLAILVIKNTGQTPAHDVVHWGEIYFDEFPHNSPLPYGDRNMPDHLRTKFTMPPGGKTFKQRGITKPLTADQIAKLRAGTHAIYVYGDIFYKDIFGKNHSSYFKYFIRGPGFTHNFNPMIGYGEGNEGD